MIIDAHVHITSPDVIKNADAIGKKEKYFGLLASNPKNKFATAKEIISEMEHCGIDKSVVFGFSYVDEYLCKEANDYTAEMTKKYSDKLIGFMAVSPNSKRLEAEVDRCLNMGLTGIGEIFPEGQHFPIEDYEVTKNFCDVASCRNLPVIIHSNEPVGHYYPGKTNTTPKQVVKFAQNHPEVKVLFAHFGGGTIFYELMPELKDILKNVYYDTAAGPLLYDKNIYHAVKSVGVMDKLVFGSDFPLISPKRYFSGLDLLSSNDAEMVLSSNLLNFLAP